MHLEPIGRFTLTYTRLDEVDSDVGGRVYGDLEGTIDGPELRGALRMTNLGFRRADGEYEPEVRGILTTPEGNKMLVTMEGISVPKTGADPGDRIALVSVVFRTADPALQAWNRVFAVAECEGGLTGAGLSLTGSVFRCLPGD